jgi:hypothetical protein
VTIDLVRSFAGASILARRMQADIVRGKEVDGPPRIFECPRSSDR